MGGIETGVQAYRLRGHAGWHARVSREQAAHAPLRRADQVCQGVRRGAALHAPPRAAACRGSLPSVQRSSMRSRAIEGHSERHNRLSALRHDERRCGLCRRTCKGAGARLRRSRPYRRCRGSGRAAEAVVFRRPCAFGVNIREEDIPCVGISSVTRQRPGRGKRPDLHCPRGEMETPWPHSFPTLFPPPRPSSHTGGTGNLVPCSRALRQKQSFSGAGAGGWPTGSNVLRDCLISPPAAAASTPTPSPPPVNLSGTQGKWLFRCMGDISSASAGPRGVRRLRILPKGRPARAACALCGRRGINSMLKSFEIRRLIACRRTPVRQGQVHRGIRPRPPGGHRLRAGQALLRRPQDHRSSLSVAPRTSSTAFRARISSP